MVWYSHLFQNFPQFLVIHTVKGFGIVNKAEIQIKYEGYIKKARKEAEKMRKLENKKIPVDIDYDKVPNLASEARVKLNLFLFGTSLLFHVQF